MHFFIIIAYLGILLLVPVKTMAQTRQYWSVTLSKSMTVTELMTKYELNEYDCDTEHFLQINNIKTKNATLKNGATYNLPVWIYAYNTVSIRKSLGITDLDLAKSIQAYNDDMLKAQLRKNTYKESHLLLVPYHAINCRGSRKVPPKTTDPTVVESAEKPIEKRDNVKGKTTRTFEIFGRNHQDVVISDKKLSGKIYYVEGGHGGPDPGAQATVEGRTLCEDEYAYDVSLRVARELIKHGATVYIITRDPNDGIRDGDFLTCDLDEQTYPDLKVPFNHKERLFQRSDAINTLYETYKKRGIKDQRLIVIHVDSRGKSQQTDTFLYYQNGNEDSKRIANAMQKTLELRYSQRRNYTGTVTTRDLHMLRECKTTTVYVELGNIRNEFDRKRIMIANNRQAIAAWLAEGFIK